MGPARLRSTFWTCLGLDTLLPIASADMLSKMMNQDCEGVDAM